MDIIYVKKVRKICAVPGCNKIGAYTISKRRGVGNMPVLCFECLERAYKEAADGLYAKDENNVRGGKNGD